MMAISAPGAGTRAYIGLEKLNQAGGSLSTLSWARAFGWSGSYSTFMTAVINPLLAREMVFLYHDHYKITEAGRARLGIAVDDAPVSAPTLAGAAYAPTPRPLSAKNMTRMPLTREGALDYRDIPSRVGDQLIAHKKA